MTDSPWPPAPLASLVSHVTSGGTPKSGDSRYYQESGTPFLKIDDLTRARTRFVGEAEHHITPAALRETAAKVMPVGTIVVSMYGTIGLSKTLAEPMATNQAMAALVPPFSCDPDYLAHALDARRPELERQANQTTQPNINGRTVRELSIAVPPLAEQRRIAEILDTLDEAIWHTDALIEKQTLLRHALGSELLTPSSHSRVSWRTARIGDALRQVVQPVTIHNNARYDLISIRRRHRGMFHRTSLEGREILDKRMQRVVPGTFVIARRQIVHGACAIAQDGYGDSVMSMSYSGFVGTEICNTDFFFALAQTPQMVRKFWNASHGVVVEKLNFQQEEWLDYEIRLPPVDEQERIVDVLRVAEMQIAAQERCRAKLAGLRAAIAMDLLSGRLRTASA